MLPGVRSVSYGRERDSDYREIERRSSPHARGFDRQKSETWKDEGDVRCWLQRKESILSWISVRDRLPFDGHTVPWYSFYFLCSSMKTTWQIECVPSGSDIGMPCGKPAVADCGDCGSAICSDCQQECCAESFCGLCYDYHVSHSCVRKPVQNERNSYPLRDSPDKVSCNPSHASLNAAGRSLRVQVCVVAALRSALPTSWGR